MLTLQLHRNARTSRGMVRDKCLPGIHEFASLLRQVSAMVSRLNLVFDGVRE